MRKFGKCVAALDRPDQTAQVNAWDLFEACPRTPTSESHGGEIGSGGERVYSPTWAASLAEEVATATLMPADARSLNEFKRLMGSLLWSGGRTELRLSDTALFACRRQAMRLEQFRQARAARQSSPPRASGPGECPPTCLPVIVQPRQCAGSATAPLPGSAPSPMPGSAPRLGAEGAAVPHPALLGQ